MRWCRALMLPSIRSNCWGRLVIVSGVWLIEVLGLGAYCLLLSAQPYQIDTPDGFSSWQMKTLSAGGWCISLTSAHDVRERLEDEHADALANSRRTKFDEDRSWDLVWFALVKEEKDYWYKAVEKPGLLILAGTARPCTFHRVGRNGEEAPGADHEPGREAAQTASR